MLQATYNSNEGTLIGRGRLSVSIKICWCFTLEIDEELTYTLGSAGNRNAAMARPERILAANGRRFLDGPMPLSDSVPALQEPPYADRANEYVAMLV
jgi:hypothetical protein